MMKKLSFWQASAIGLGNIIGAGIFVLAGSAIKEAGPSAVLAFLITASLATSIGFNSSELASKIQGVEGGVYSFARYVFGDTIGFTVGWFRIISYAVSGTAVALGFSGYLVGLGFPASQDVLLSIFLIIALALIEMQGVSLTAKIEETLVFINLLGLAVFIIYVLSRGLPSGDNLVPLFPYGVSGVLKAANLGFFAYSGFNTIATLTPDVEDGPKVVPKAILFSLFISSLLYMLILFSLLAATRWSNYTDAGNPLSLALVTLNAPLVVRLLVAFSALTATLTVTFSLILAGSRTITQMSRDGLLPGLLERKKWIPTLFIALTMNAFLFIHNVGDLALIANFGVVFSYMLSGFEVIKLRHLKIRGAFESPWYPYSQIFSMILSIILLLNLGLKSITIGLITLIVGLLIHRVPSYLKKVTA